MLEAFAILFILVGLVFFFGCVVGLIRFPDLYTRMHAAGKGDTLSRTRGKRSYQYSNVYPVSRILFEGFFPMCPRYPESIVSMSYPDFKVLLPPEKRYPHEGRASAITPDPSHPMSLVFRPDEDDP